MNTVESYQISSPLGVEEECSKFVIDDITSPFILRTITKPDLAYTYSCWLRSDTAGGIIVAGRTFVSTDSWTKCSVTFTTAREDLPIEFLSVGTYYIYHPQLEVGNKATDWNPSPEDIETKFAVLNKCIASLVTNEHGGSLMEQTENGWSFNIGSMQNELNKVGGDLGALAETVGNMDKALNILKQQVENDPLTNEYVEIGTFEDEPCIAFSESDSDYKLLITNTRILFIYGGTKNANDEFINYSILTFININGLVTDTIEVKKEIKQGGFAWITHGNGNLGLVWRGV